MIQIRSADFPYPEADTILSMVDGQATFDSDLGEGIESVHLFRAECRFRANESMHRHCTPSRDAVPIPSKSTQQSTLSHVTLARWFSRFQVGHRVNEPTDHKVHRLLDCISYFGEINATISAPMRHLPHRIPRRQMQHWRSNRSTAVSPAALVLCPSPAACRSERK